MTKHLLPEILRSFPDLSDGHALGFKGWILVNNDLRILQVELLKMLRYGSMQMTHRVCDDGNMPQGLISVVEADLVPRRCIWHPNHQILNFLGAGWSLICEVPESGVV